MDYWDTSCVLKLYTPEPDSDRFLDWSAQSTDPLCSSDLLKTELYYALRRKEERREIKLKAADRIYAAFARDIEKGRFVLVPVGEDIQQAARQFAEACFSRKPSIYLRTLDGLHLASAFLARTKQIVTADDRMRLAAKRLGLALRL